MDNKEAIEILRKGYPDINKYAPSELEDFDDDVREYDEAVHYAISHLEADRWIPVSERLPEEKKDTNTNDFAEVLCTTIFGGVRLYKYGTRIGDKQAHFWYGFGIFDSEITAWKYKPEPYKENEGDN